jgi:hypothetical protein
LKITEIETTEIEACQIDSEDFVNSCGLLGNRNPSVFIVKIIIGVIKTKQ